MADQMRQLRHGEILDGLPRQPINWVLDRMRGDVGGDPLAGLRSSSVQFEVKNGTANPVGRFGVLQVTGPRATYVGAGSGMFFDEDVLVGATPAAGFPFVILQEPVSAGGFGVARVLGATRCKVNIVATTDRFADCTTDPTKLTSGGGGARILWTEDAFAGTGDKWAVVLLTGVARKARFIRFTLPSALAKTDASKASCTVDGYWDGSNPGATVTVYNLPASTNYIFSGASGKKGLAVYDETSDHYVITQMEC